MRLGVEPLDERITPATFEVTSTGGNPQVQGTLPYAITQANNDAVKDDIVFQIGMNQEFTIALNAELPKIINPVNIFVKTDGNFVGQRITLSGVNAPGTASGLVFGRSPGTPTTTASGSEVRGLTIVKFGSAGILIDGITATNENPLENIVIETCFIGTNAANATDLGNGFGVQLKGATKNNTIGGADAADRNTISGNTAGGILLQSVEAQAGDPARLPINNHILMNFIGVGQKIEDGQVKTVTIPNQRDGVKLQGARENWIVANIISGNKESGIRVVGGDLNEIRANRIGTDISGESAVANEHYGIEIGGSATNTMLGAAAPSTGNVISGNTMGGVSITGPSAFAHLVNNRIGTNVNGSERVPNGGFGVKLYNSNGNSIGVPFEGGNLISGNDGSGVILEAGSTNNFIMANRIGTKEGATAKLENKGEGILINNSPNNLIGGSAIAARNVISGNMNNGIKLIGADAKDNLIQNNNIGIGNTRQYPLQPLENGGKGINFDTQPNLKIRIIDNSICYNKMGGVTNEPQENPMPNEGEEGLLPGDSSTIELNEIWYNEGPGISLFGGRDNLIKNNSIAFNTGDGILLDQDAENNTFRDNTISSNGGPVFGRALGNSILPSSTRLPRTPRAAFISPTAPRRAPSRSAKTPWTPCWWKTARPRWSGSPRSPRWPSPAAVTSPARASSRSSGR